MLLWIKLDPTLFPNERKKRKTELLQTFVGSLEWISLVTERFDSLFVVFGYLLPVSAEVQPIRDILDWAPETMESQEGLQADAESEHKVSIPASDVYAWENIRDDDIMQQQSAIRAEEAEKVPFIGDKARPSCDTLKF